MTAEPAHDQGGAAAADRGRAAAARGARRGLPPRSRLRPHQRAARRGRRAHLREPAQHRGGFHSPARPAESRPRGRCRSGATASGRSRGSSSNRTSSRSSWLREHGFKVNPDVEVHDTVDEADRRLPRLGGQARPARLRDRRRGGQGRRPGAPGPARRGGPGAARGDRLEVRAQYRQHHLAADRLERGPHPPPGPVRPARAGPGLGCDRQARHPAQRGGPAPQGRARRGRGDRAAGR